MQKSIFSRPVSIKLFYGFLLALLCLGLVGGWLIHRRAQQVEERMAKEETEHQVFMRTMTLEKLRALSAEIHGARAMIAAHDDIENDLDYSTPNGVKEYLERDGELRDILYQKVEEYNRLADALGCQYPDQLELPVPDGTSIMLPCVMEH